MFEMHMIFENTLTGLRIKALYHYILCQLESTGIHYARIDWWSYLKFKMYGTLKLPGSVGFLIISAVLLYPYVLLRLPPIYV